MDRTDLHNQTLRVVPGVAFQEDPLATAPRDPFFQHVRIRYRARNDQTNKLSQKQTQRSRSGKNYLRASSFIGSLTIED